MPWRRVERRCGRARERLQVVVRVMPENRSNPEERRLLLRLGSEAYTLEDKVRLEIEIVNSGDGPVAFFERLELGEGRTLDQNPIGSIVDKFGNREPT